MSTHAQTVTQRIEALDRAIASEKPDRIRMAGIRLANALDDLRTEVERIIDSATAEDFTHHNHGLAEPFKDQAA